MAAGAGSGAAATADAGAGAASVLSSGSQSYTAAADILAGAGVDVQAAGAVTMVSGTVLQTLGAAGVATLGAGQSFGMMSLLTGKPVRRKLAMTGEITLRGDVLPVGGIKEKVLAARRAKIHTVLLPALNRRDLEDVNEAIRNDMQFIFVSTIQEVFKHALVEPPAKKKAPGVRSRQRRHSRIASAVRP